MRRAHFIFPLLAILLCTMSLSAREAKPSVWQEIDTLIAQGHYTTAYEKSSKLLKTAKRKGDSHSILKATHKQRLAAAHYQEGHIEGSVEAYQSIIPLLQGADRGVAYMMLGAAIDDYENRHAWHAAEVQRRLTAEMLCTITPEEMEQWSREQFAHAKRLCYEEALTESEALKAVSTEDYDLLVKGDTLGRRLQPTLYDVVMHEMVKHLYFNNTMRSRLRDQRHLLFGTTEEFLSLIIPNDSTSHELWQLAKLQTLTRHHLSTSDAAVRAHIDRRRMETMNAVKYMSNAEEWHDAYHAGLERIAMSYTEHPTEEAMFRYLQASDHAPELYAYSDKETIEKELLRAEKMERYLERIRQIAPESEWARLGKALYERVTLPQLELQSHITILPGQESSMTLMVRNAGDILYRFTSRLTGENTGNFVYQKVIERKPVGKAYIRLPHEYPNPYAYQKIELTIPPLAAGDYFLIAGNAYQKKEDRRTSISAFTVSNLKLSMQLNEAEGEYIGMVIDATTGRAVTNCEVDLLETSNGKTHHIQRFSPDRKGYFTVPLPTGKYRNLYLRASDGASQATYTFRYGDFTEHYRSYAENNSWDGGSEDAQTLFTFLPDRLTYKPGEQVQFSLIAYSHGEKGSRVKSHLPINVSLLNARRKEVSSQKGTTDEWGCFHGTFAIPADATPGEFRLQATDSLSGRTLYHNIKVESFKAPTFTAELNRPQATIHFGDSLTLHGKATTFTGLPVANAKVQYEVSVSSMTIFGYYPLRDGYLQKISGTTTTDEKGLIHIPLKVGAASLPEENATYNYIITANVTDPSGETQTTKTSFVVGNRTKHIDFVTPERLVMHGDSIGYGLFTLNGGRLAENVTLRLSKLAVPHSNNIRSSVEGDRDTWAEERLIINRSEQTASDKSNYLLLTDEMPCGVYRLTITYIDGEQEYSESYHFGLWGEGKHTVSSYALYQSAMKERYVQTGDTAVLYIGTRHKDVYAHYYIRVEDRIVDKGTLSISDETTSLRIPIREEWHNRMAVYLVSVKNNVTIINTHVCSVENKTSQLNVHLSTLRDYLEPGETEQCTISVRDYYGNPVEAALTMSIYDAALDTYGKNYWDIALAPIKWGRGVTIEEHHQSAWSNNIYHSAPQPTKPKYYTLPGRVNSGEIFYSLAPPATTRGRAKNSVGFDSATSEDVVLEETAEESKDSEASEPKTQEPYLRQDLRHTALFLPTLRTDEQGQVTFTLTAPDLLTRWHVKGIAHTKDLKHGRVESSFVTRKTLMVQPNVPRFLYEGDTCDFTAKVSSSGDEPIEAVVELTIEDEKYSQEVSIDPKGSASVSFPIIAPAKKDCLTYHITARSLRFSDAEQATIAILPRRTLVTETMALYVNGREKREFVFDALKAKHSPTLEHKSLTLELVSNPIWFAIEALPPLCQEENPSNERLFHRYYAATMGTYLIDHYPEVEGYSGFYHRDSLIALQQSLLNRLSETQQSDGGWAWMDGFSSSLYVTQLIVKGLGELESMGCIAIAQDEKLYAMLKQGIAYLDRTYQNDFDQMKHKPKALDSNALYYLYVRTMFPELPFAGGKSTAYEHYKNLLSKDKATRGTLMQKALKMLALIRMGENSKASKVAKVVKESSLESDEMGIYWRDNRYGYGWDSNPVATQAFLIEAFVRLGEPTDMVARMQQWLLKQKQTTQWSNSIATAQAIHALMGASPLPLPRRGDTDNPDDVNVKVKNATLHQIEKDKRGTVRYEVTPEKDKRTSTMPEIPLLIEGSEEAPSMAWGSITWQYYEDIDKVRSSGTGLTLKCSYYKVENREGKENLIELSDGLTSLFKGDRVRVRLQFTADRAMDYVELHLRRPAALETTSTHSGYTYSNGLSYYRSIENTQTAFYFYRLDKGKYAIDTDLWVSQSGNYSCGISTIQCMYAPAFVATAESMRLDSK